MAAIPIWPRQKRMGSTPLRLAFCWTHGRRKLIKAKPQKDSPTVDEALLRIVALYKIEASFGSDSQVERIGFVLNR